MKTQYLLVGDSIRMGYSPLVKKEFRKIAQLIPIKQNCSDSEVVKKNLPKWLKHRKVKNLKVVHFNCGLHDIKRPFGAATNQIPLEEYKSNLREIIQILRNQTQAKLIWATTTPVIYERHHKNKPFDRDDDIVKEYNGAALKIMDEYNIQINDLHQVINADSPEKCIKDDGVHMTERGNSLLAKAVIKTLQDYL